MVWLHFYYEKMNCEAWKEKWNEGRCAPYKVSTVVYMKVEDLMYGEISRNQRGQIKFHRNKQDLAAKANRHIRKERWVDYSKDFYSR